MIKTLFKLLRWPNLVIIGLTQYLLKYAVFYPIYQQAEISFSLNDWQYASLVLFTMLVAGGGYIINDIYDHAIDLSNKPERVIVGKIITLRQAWWLYGLSCFISLVLAGLLIEEMVYALPIVACSCVLLWLYSYRLKRLPFWGNLTVGVFCAVVPLLVWLAEASSFQALTQSHSDLAIQLKGIVLFYTLFALLSTLYREVVKDIEDVEGDRLYGCRTLPIQYGVGVAKSIALLFGSSIVLAILFWLWDFNAYINLAGMIYGGVALLLPTIYTLWLLQKASTTQQFGKISTYIKMIMLLGLVYLLVL